MATNRWEEANRAKRVLALVGWIQEETLGAPAEAVLNLVRSWGPKHWAEAARQTNLKSPPSAKTQLAVIERLEAPILRRREREAEGIARREAARRARRAVAPVKAVEQPPRRQTSKRDDLCPVCGGLNCRKSSCSAETGIRKAHQRAS
jgi:hypothetical protein